jgi:hypothetical protein
MSRGPINQGDEMADEHDHPERPPSGHEPAVPPPGGFTPDPDDLRPFPEVCEEGVDRAIQELLRAAHAAHPGRTRLE